MVAAVVEDYAEIHHRIPGKVAAGCRFNNALFHGRNVVLGNGSAKDVIHKLKVLAALQRLHLDLAVAILSVAAALLLVPSLDIGLAPDGFAVRDLGSF